MNCAQYHDGQLLASELFGHRKGAFTGAIADHRGVFEEADGGVVFLDEVGELCVPAQAMLLRALGEGEILPVGATQSKRVNVRVIAATSRDLRPMIEAGRFREDLYYRLRHLHVRVPALRERGDDWRLVLELLRAQLAARRGSRKRFSDAALNGWARYAWPGNVRELRSARRDRLLPVRRRDDRGGALRGAPRGRGAGGEGAGATATGGTAPTRSRMTGGAGTFWSWCTRRSWRAS